MAPSRDARRWRLIFWLGAWSVLAEPVLSTSRPFIPFARQAILHGLSYKVGLRATPTADDLQDAILSLFRVQDT